MVVCKIIFERRKVGQERSTTTLITGFTNKILKNLETPLNNNVFGFNIYI